MEFYKSDNLFQRSDPGYKVINEELQKLRTHHMQAK